MEKSMKKNVYSFVCNWITAVPQKLTQDYKSIVNSIKNHIMYSF